MGQLIIGISGLRLTQEEQEILQDPRIEGIILFSRNYQSPSQLKELTNEIHSLRIPKLSIYVDQEGGRVQRFREGFTLLPSLGEIKSVKEAFLQGQLMAHELKQIGVDYSFAPVVDLDRGSRVIGNRAFSDDPYRVVEFAESYLMGMKKANMEGIIKHFPGHGTAIADTHLEMAVDARSFAEIEEEDLIPFQHFIQRSVFGVMVSHVIYPTIDADPVSLSHFWLTEILRKKLDFKGNTFSDDLGMQAVSRSGSPLSLVKATFAAGADYALLCNDWQAVKEVLHKWEG